MFARFRRATARFPGRRLQSDPRCDTSTAWLHRLPSSSERRSAHAADLMRARFGFLPKKQGALATIRKKKGRCWHAAPAPDVVRRSCGVTDGLNSKTDGSSNYTRRDDGPWPLF